MNYGAGHLPILKISEIRRKSLTRKVIGVVIDKEMLLGRTIGNISVLFGVNVYVAGGYGKLLIKGSLLLQSDNNASPLQGDAPLWQTLPRHSGASRNPEGRCKSFATGFRLPPE